MANWDLARLVAPVSREVFLAEYWDKRPLLCARRDGGYFASLFGLDDVEPFLQGYGVVAGAESMRLVKRGMKPPALPIFGVAPDLAAIHAAFRDGYTLNVNDIASHHAGFRRLVHALTPDLGVRPHPNLYFTPPWSRAFDLHFDTHDVLIVQLAGKKEWRVYPPIEANPTDEASDGASVPRSAVGAPLHDVVLEAGDTLYVPRGFVHEAYTDDELSLHVTLGVVMGTYLDLLQRLVAQAGAKRPALRASMPPGALFGRARPEVTAALARLIAEELSTDLVDETMEAWASSALLQMPALDVPRSFESAPPIGLDDPLRKPEGLFARVSASYGRARVCFQHGVVEGPWKVCPALTYVVENAVVTARALPGRLSDEEKLVLVRRMVRDGLLVPAR